MKLNISALLNALAFFACLALAAGADGIANLLIH